MLPVYDVIYPNIQKWMDENGMKRCRFLEEIKKRGGSAGYEWLTGNVNPGFNTIKGVLALTGMTFEEAFKE